ncbi:Spermidine N(1)-acetyltransferase [Microbacterium lemovicicum]|uniref:Spermidine N(1)-acetyltransferase n=1 Tax=Microbacterium lemovicicum TaxID=1072463 RepID=A0A3Q9J2A5_9MICO|nr:GNAT family protein [Microbacterium lemovicicum]AZS36896.1 Spermidine N(1)-acetyltransferase [Microbacterium lemovicicum]
MATTPFTLPPAPSALRLETPRLVLRLLEEADIPAMTAYRGDPEVCRFLPFDPQSADDIRGRIGHLLGSTALDGERGGVALAVVRAADDVLIGDLVLFHLDADSGTAELGWVTHPAARGHGLATEAVTALIDAAFEVYGLRRLVARIDGDNTASRALAARVGMREEAHLIQASWFNGRWADEVDTAILADEWRARRAGATAGVRPPAGRLD